MWATNFCKSFFKNILLYINGRSSKIHSVHMYIMTWTVYFDCNCKLDNVSLSLYYQNVLNVMLPFVSVLLEIQDIKQFRICGMKAIIFMILQFQNLRPISGKQSCFKMKVQAVALSFVAKTLIDSNIWVLNHQEVHMT